jgi:hypothetical protein
MANPVDEVVRGARAYTKRAGLLVPETDYSQAIMTEPASRAIGAAHDALPEFDPKAVPAYHQMREETMRQFDHMTAPRSRGGMGIDVEVTKHDPYGSRGVNSVVGEFRDDVVENNRIQALSTKSTGGHPFFSNDENDMFRAVHDVYGHLGSGRGIDFDGEEAAFQKHSRMYSPLARQAMATETRGQNSALRMHGEFQDQKVGLLPSHMQGLQFSRSGGPQAVAAAQQRADMKNKAQGL